MNALQKLSPRHRIIFIVLLMLFCVAAFFFYQRTTVSQHTATDNDPLEEQYWFLLHRKSQVEYFYQGVPGNKEQSTLLKTFTVKTGAAGKKPTPLPQLLGRDYWLLVDKLEASDNPETAPYFLVLDVPIPEEEPYGPEPYLECDGQCNWELPGYFGLHGIADDPSKLSAENEGSSGCVRHKDEDITYLYNLLDPKKQEIRYYIQDK